MNPSTYILQHQLEHVRLRAGHGSKVVDDVNSILDFRVAAPSELLLCPSLDILYDCLSVMAIPMGMNRWGRRAMKAGSAVLVVMSQQV